MPPVTTAPARAPEDRRADAASPAIVVPFTRASREHAEPFLDRTSPVLGANTYQIGPEDVPAFGYMRNIVLTLTFAGGAGGSAVLKEDAPFSAIQEVVLTDVNGAPLVGPLSGYDLYLINKYGGYAFNPDPKASGAYTALDANGNGQVVLRIPAEISARDALGALANQNAASTYKLRVTIAGKADVFSTDPAGALPTVRVRAHLEAWTQPAGTDLRGMPQATTPPANGTTQFWSKFVKNLASGANTIQLPRVGNLLRTLIFIFRTTTPARSSTNFPDPVQFLLDSRILNNVSKDLLNHYMTERYGFAKTNLDTGVFVVDYTHDFDGHPGGELRDLYLPTTQASRLELVGSFGADGTLTVLTNDVAPAGEIFI